MAKEVSTTIVVQVILAVLAASDQCACLECGALRIDLVIQFEGGKGVAGVQKPRVLITGKDGEVTVQRNACRGMKQVVGDEVFVAVVLEECLEGFSVVTHEDEVVVDVDVSRFWPNVDFRIQGGANEDGVVVKKCPLTRAPHKASAESGHPEDLPFSIPRISFRVDSVAIIDADVVTVAAANIVA